jgi:hypothetical protein
MNIHALSEIRTRNPIEHPQSYALDRTASGIGYGVGWNL